MSRKRTINEIMSELARSGKRVYILAVSVEGNWDESMNHKEYTEEFKSRVSDSSSFRCELYAMSGGCFGFVVYEVFAFVCW